MRFFFRFALTALAIYLLIQYGYLQGVTFAAGTTSLLVFTFILGLVNLIVGGALRLITFPIRWLTLGILGFAISLFVVYLTDEFVTGVTLIGWTPIIIIALVMGVISAIMG
ncbi:phage holin family protein [Candidatus Gracilibacteria bacterium]|nr:phage holin family protein [Candidatus Gracilibacteria bacterium]